MKLQIYDPQPFRNEYVSLMYFDPMRAYARDHGIEIQDAGQLVPSAGFAMICNADYLTPQVIMHFKENNCEIFGFSCIDSAFLPETLRYAPEVLLVNRIFMVTGVQKTNISNATVVDSDFTIRSEPRRFVTEEAWDRFELMRERNALNSLPYPHWMRTNTPGRIPYGAKRPTVLFRGGAHFTRMIACMMALRDGVLDPWSGFQLRYYFAEDMNPKFRYCEECRAIFSENGNTYPVDKSNGVRGKCNSPAMWGDELDLTNSCHWNNRCPKSWFWLAEQFQKTHGPIDMKMLSAALNYQGQNDQDHQATVRDVRFYADAKWEFTINIAQRFWEAASVGTVNLMPKRTADQDYFPKLIEGEHYLTFNDDLSNISEVVRNTTEEDYQRIADNAYALWEQWMRPTGYKISDSLLAHIFRLIHTPRNT